MVKREDLKTILKVCSLYVSDACVSANPLWLPEGAIAPLGAGVTGGNGRSGWVVGIELGSSARTVFTLNR